MPELRKDPVIGRWVIISTERKLRPNDYAGACSISAEEENSPFCPFCPGSEAKTPPEIYAIRENSTQPNTPGWLIRVVPNKYPALRIEGDLNKKGVGIFDRMNGIGAHEVIIETPEHKQQMQDFQQNHLERVLYTYQLRSLDLKNDKRFKYSMIFKNYGREAGASLYHSHTQLIATPVTPKRVKEELKGAQWYYDYKERCIFCDIIEDEISKADRVVAVNNDFIALVPYASRFPFELWLLPLRHSPDFDSISDSERQTLAQILGLILKKLIKGLCNPSYNFIIHTAPNRFPHPGYWQTIDKDYHWHIEIMPRLTRPGGFEWGTGFYINPTPPEEAAQFLRELPV
ncbi:MAG: galactose-1-phosphate uridylyltransferase [Candidatus Omnitrophica bacterium]|nr:galactose-1-phosphate uridylyltransferase [Candidatus Omnitrophota bacterium]MCM8824972.1 galactose-1-phosphate uridylyltransferase [Candidatus Omnitrophota bacterium]